ncbi:MAG TPA: YbaB/EbfC family nucleoid-associated protein [Candidatus Rifleibacterium sp.]|jgi:DNA-binding YbaB/EbfC family protein|nr:YbaB/EbfC family nucleoid-associated protein [Candidatus Rifleibacterium sp.]HPW58566.1 YbaB/EbfC family nucleoid-associated protein [Candidatus Rifleibacterium sp.]HQB83009.1 YbaB/EbfC family nucleoid-associated protein [Candidatus Rifleibacterium sp.]
MKGGLNMQGLMRQAQKMQEKIQKAQDELKDKTIEATVGGGIIKVVFNGAQEMVKIEINKEAVDPDDVETLQDLVLSAVNAGLAKSKEMVQNEMGQITGGMNIPGMF